MFPSNRQFFHFESHFKVHFIVLQLQFQLNKNMEIDLYLIVTPLFAGLLILSLITLKLSLKGANAITKSMVQKVRKNSSANKDEEAQPKSIFQTNQTLRIFSFLMITQSFLEPCLTQRSKNKIPLFLAFSIMALLCAFSPSLYLFCFVGALTAIGFVLVESCLDISPKTHEQTDANQFLHHAKQQLQQGDKKKYIYIGISVVTAGLFLGVCGLTYKNYQNSMLENFMVGFLVNCAIDIFVARPVIFIIASLPLAFSVKMIVHIEEEKLRNKASKIYERQDILQPTVSPKKKQGNSPTKIPRAIKMEKQKQSNKDEIPKQIMKKVKKEKKVVQSLITPLNQRDQGTNKTPVLDEFSLNHLFEQDKTIDGHIQTPVAQFHFNQQDQMLQPSSAFKPKKRGSQLMIISFKNKEEEQKSQINSSQEDQQLKQYSRKRNRSFIHSNFDFDGTLEMKEDEKNEKNEENQQEGLRIIKIMQRCDEQILIQDQMIEKEKANKKKKHQENNFLTHKHGLLKINENEVQERQIEEIDLNSPSKKRRVPMYMGDAESQIEEIKKKKRTKYNYANAKKRVVQFTSGEPYLQYLPKILSKEANQHNKRSQQINFKPDMTIEQRPRKSLKRIGEQRENRGAFAENNENQNPEGFFIEDL